MFAIGDIVGLNSPTAGHYKYHLCIAIANDAGVTKYLFMNSSPDFEQTFAVECARVPCLPESKTGKTVFSFATIPQFNERQLGLFKAEKLGELDRGLAAELYEFAKTVTVMTRKERTMVLEALKIFAGIDD